MHVQENSQCQFRLHCATHDCGHAKRPHRLVPRAGPRAEPRSTSLQTLVLGRLKNNGFVVRAPRNFGNFLCPACQRAGHMPAAGGQTPRTPRRGWWVADALERNRLASQFHPARPGLRFRHFPARRCRKSSRVHKNGDATLWRKNASCRAAETEICPKGAM